jgi:uncharacterized protein (TIGR03435 family)
MIRTALVFSIPALLTSALLAQDAAVPAFDVASIKRNTSGDARTRFGLPPGRFVAINASTAEMIRTAFQVSAVQIVDLPAWASSERFDITATTSGGNAAAPGPMALGAGGPPPRLYQMRRSLLPDRFGPLTPTPGICRSTS